MNKYTEEKKTHKTKHYFLFGLHLLVQCHSTWIEPSKHQWDFFVEGNQPRHRIRKHWLCLCNPQNGNGAFTG